MMAVKAIIKSLDYHMLSEKYHYVKSEMTWAKINTAHIKHRFLRLLYQQIFFDRQEPKKQPGLRIT